MFSYSPLVLLLIVFALFISTIQKQLKQTNNIIVIYYKILFIFVVVFFLFIFYQ